MEEIIKELEKKIKEEGNFHIFYHKGLIGLIIRPHIVYEIYDDWKKNMIHWCGYVLIPENTSLGKWVWEKAGFLENNLDVHGGITYCEKKEGLIWIGFDTAHHGDISHIELHISSDATYKDKEYVIKETKSLIEQILYYFAVDTGLKIELEDL